MRLLYDSRGQLSCRELPGGRFQVEVRVPLEAATVPRPKTGLIAYLS
jgi:hypothetical protein